MRKRVLPGGVAGLFAVLLLPAPERVHAQITSIGEFDFSDRADTVPLALLVRGSPASEALSLYGIRFSGDASVPIRESVVIHLAVPPEFDEVIQNEPIEGTSAGKALTLLFREPLRRIGFTLSNGTFATVATLQALTRKGELLGSLDFDEVRAASRSHGFFTFTPCR